VVTPPLTCPLCAGSLTLDDGAVVVEEYAITYQLRGDPIPTRLRRTTVVSCNCCEFAATWDASRQRLRVLC
jgi:hypothetical protein